MYPIDFATCTAVDVIERSLVCHPTTFRDAIIAAGNAHFGYARNPGAGQRGAMSAGRSCSVVAAILCNDIYPTPRDKAERMARDVGPLVQAFTVAANLNLVPHFMRGDIIGRTPTASAA